MSGGDARTLTRRELLRLGALTAGGVLLAACAPAVPTPAPEAPKVVEEEPPAAAPESVAITMWTHDALYVEFFTTRGNVWKEDYPQYDIRFEFEQIPYAEVFTKVLANLAAGSGAPDLVGIEISQFSRFMVGDIAEKGLVDLTDWIGDERAKFVEGRWTPYMHQGKIYGVESALCPVGYWYQPAILEDRYGVEMPIETWQDFAAIGRQLVVDGVYMAPVDDLDVGTFMMYLQQRGGKLFAEDGSVTLDSPEAIEALEFLVNGANQGEFYYKAGADSYWGPATLTAYSDGVIAGAVMPDWYLGATLKTQLPEMEGQWRLSVLPLWPAGGHRTSTWGGTGFAITRQSQHADLVWSLLHFTYMTLESQVLRFQQINYFPHMIEAFSHPGVIEREEPFCGGQRTGAVFASVAEDIPLQWQSPHWSEAMERLSDYLTRAYAGEITPEQAIKEADARIKELAAREG